MTKSNSSKKYKLLAVLLKDARRAARLTQQSVADRLGKSQSFVAKVEAGGRRLDVFDLQRLAKIYRKTVDHFLRQS